MSNFTLKLGTTAPRGFSRNSKADCVSGGGRSATNASNVLTEGAAVEVWDKETQMLVYKVGAGGAGSGATRQAQAYLTTSKALQQARASLHASAHLALLTCKKGLSE